MFRYPDTNFGNLLGRKLLQLFVEFGDGKHFENGEWRMENGELRIEN